ncbi:MAG: hypothetical protein WBL63_22600 [Candidatus Acidiferrum sp.]
MKQGLIFILAASASCALGQDMPRTNVVYQSSGAGIVTAGAIGKGMSAPVQGAPYSATITNESVQTLADGNRIAQNSTGTTARDSQGRTRQDAALPTIGNLSAANAPHLVFIMDPVAQVSYTLNLTDKTAHKIPMPAGGAGIVGGAVGTKVFVTQFADSSPMGGGAPAATIGMKMVGAEEHAQVNTEDLGTETMEGLLVTGARTTRTIPAGEIGNDKPISIVTEVWTSPDLKTIVYSKRSDPRMGEQTFKLTNIVRAEPDASQFSVPADFKLTDSPQNFVYHTNH